MVKTLLKAFQGDIIQQTAMCIAIEIYAMLYNVIVFIRLCRAEFFARLKSPHDFNVLYVRYIVLHMTVFCFIFARGIWLEIYSHDAFNV